ncbi:DNA alkylation repair protein [Thermosipho sp. (in: thermotogales)]|uniref:DNA alkylation repair protein n=1 Tax=Thermosipho sp. (in: thermotogales) TaxID=1968895 RepID=UPI00257F1F45|nr:DNA alkylation repair protein [Thermosipho sp. (in: thermotogales)]MBZ4649559.1 alkylation repair enzyme superfamily [Thermosipho sp. (in: thermotogales)]
MLEEIIKELENNSNEKKAKASYKFLKAFPGGYGEGDEFLGLTVPIQRKIAKKYKNLPLEDVEKLLQSKYHEHRLTALFILILNYKNKKEEVINIYLRNLDRVNNWDLVDSSAPYLLGPYLENKDKSILYELAKSDNLWKQRVAIITTFYFIKKKDFKDALKISELLLNHKHDLIHKAVGWMLREIGKRDKKVEEEFLKKYYKKMPRTMLRYAIEKFPEEERQKILKGIW